MRRVGSRERRGWSSLLICGHSQTWAAVVLTPLPDTNGPVEVEGRDLGQPRGFQSPQIKVACSCPFPAQAAGQGGRRGRKLSPTQKSFGASEPVAMCSEAGTGKSGSQKQEGRSYPCPGGGGGMDVRQGQQDFIFLYELQALAAWPCTAYALIYFP